MQMSVLQNVWGGEKPKKGPAYGPYWVKEAATHNHSLLVIRTAHYVHLLYTIIGREHYSSGQINA